MIIKDCPNIMCTDPLYSGRCKKECIERYEKEMGAKQADLVEVVRCKDCKHYNNMCLMTDDGTSLDDFCSYGERRDGE